MQDTYAFDYNCFSVYWHIYKYLIFKLKSFKMNIRKTTSERITCAFCKIYGDSPNFKSNGQFIIF